MAVVVAPSSRAASPAQESRPRCARQRRDSLVARNPEWLYVASNRRVRGEFTISFHSGILIGVQRLRDECHHARAASALTRVDMSGGRATRPSASFTFFA